MTSRTFPASTGPTPPYTASPDPAVTVANLSAELRDRLARYAFLTERVGIGVYRSSADGRFLEVNSVLAAMLGYENPADLLALDLGRDVYVDPNERDRLRQRPVDGPPPHWEETKWRRRDGRTITVRLSVRAISSENGGGAAYEGLVEDVTERHRRDEVVRRSERMASLGTTLAGVAHELNNPLAAIIGFSQLLLKRPWSDEDRSALETIRHEAIRSAGIVKDLLALTRRRDDDRRIPVSLNDIVAYIARTRRYALETAGIACRIELDPALPLVRGDRAQLEQVLLNLLHNAEHALRSADDRSAPPRSARVVLRTRRDGGWALLEVEDNGPGISEDEQTHIWDPFWTTKDDGEGTGLGLAVVHGIVADHGGTVGMENAPGSGALFAIRLPTLSSREDDDTGKATRPLDVLIVAPGASDLVFVERFLTSRGHAVINAGSAERAQRIAERTAFDAVVCESGLLLLDGTHVAAALRATPGCASARFVLTITDAGEPPPEQPALDGAGFVKRPYDVEALRRLIEGD